jgi:hypothetical protein
MRISLPLLAALLAATVQVTEAATASPIWSATALPTRSGALLPASGKLAAADARGDVALVAAQGDGAEGCLVTLKYSGASGALAWRRDACGAGAANAVAVAIDAAGNVVVAGNSNGTFRLVKYSGASGSPLWEQRAPGGALDIAWGLALDPAGDVFLMGKAAGPSTEVWVAKHRGADGSLAWQQPVDSGAEVTPAGIATDGSGNAFIIGNYRNSSGDADWNVARLAGSSGAVVWRKIYDSGSPDVATAIAIDRAGDVVVAGISTIAGGTVAKTVKNAGATGRTLWERNFPASGSAASGAHAVAVDASGNVAITGFAGGDIATVKYGGDGAALWQAIHAAAPSASDAGHGIGFDAAGDVVVTGVTYSSSPEMKTIKYAGAGGAEQWASSRPGTGAADRGIAVVAVPDGVLAIGALTQASQPAGVSLLKFGGGSARPEGLNVQGLWWKGASESGWGVNLTQQGDVLFATWFTYDAQGQGMWLVMSNGERVGDNSYAGTLYRTRGPAFNSVPLESTKVAVSAVGSASFSFSDANNGVFRYTVNGVPGAKAITRQVFSTPPTCALGLENAGLPNYQDLWWSRDGTESGWGVNVTHQGDTLFITWFTYGSGGDGMWLVGSNLARAGNATYAGTLYRTVGPPFDSPAWNASQVGIAPAGHATLVFSDGDNGTFTYTLDGVSQSKPIARQVFANPKTVCR